MDEDLNNHGDNGTLSEERIVEERLARLEQQLALQIARNEDMVLANAELTVSIAELARRRDEPFQHTPVQQIDTNALAMAIATAMRGVANVASLPSPPSFSGESDSLEWSTFLELFEKNLQLNGWSDLTSESRAQLLQSCLRLQAANVFHTLADTQKVNYELAVAALTRI